MSTVNLLAAPFRGTSRPGLEWVRRDIYNPAQRWTITFDGHELPVLELGYSPGESVSILAVTPGEWSEDEERPGRVFKLSLVVRV